MKKAITLWTVREVLRFLDGFDGWGMTATDELLQVEAIRKGYGHLLLDDYEADEDDEEHELEIHDIETVEDE